MVKRLSILLLLSIVALTPALAQEYRGNLYVEVKTEDGQPIVGATVNVTGVGATRTQETNDRGEARFIKLEPSKYTVEVSKDGFNTLISQGVEINTAANTTLPVALARSEVVEEVVVTARTPVMDKRKTGTSTVINPEEVNQIPTARDPWAVLSTVPGIQADRINVGGNQSGQQSNFAGRGDDGDNTTWVMDGVEFTDLAAQGGSATYFDWNSFQEIGFVTGGGDLEQSSPGNRLSFSTKQGTNRHSGSLGLLIADQAFQSSPGTQYFQPDDIDDALGTGTPDGNPDQVEQNEITQVFEKNFEIGGPMVRDQAWYWFGFSQNDINISLPGPGTTRVADRTQLQNISAKLNGTIGDTSLKGFYTRGDKVKIGRNAGPDRPPETSWDQEGPTPIYTFDIGHFFTQDLEVSGQFSHVGGGFQLIPQGIGATQVQWDDQFIWRNTYLDYVTDRPTDIFAARLNWFADAGATSHEVKFGFKYKEGEVQSLTGWGTQDTIAVQWADEAWLFRQGTAKVNMEYTSAWAGDTILLGNWTFNVGVLWQNQTGTQLAGEARANALCPACIPATSFAGYDPGVDWDDFLPRVGLTYTFEGNRRQLIRASFNRYADQLAFVDVGYNHPMNPAEIDYDWNDLNGNLFVDPLEFNPAAPIFISGMVPGSGTPLDPATSTALDKIDSNYEAPRVDEYILGYEIELAKDFSLGLTGTLRTRDREIWNPLYDVGQFTASNGQTLVPVDPSLWQQGTLINSTVQCVGTFDCLAPGENEAYMSQAWVTSGAAVNSGAINANRVQMRTNRPGYEEEWTGAELTLTKRLSNRWMLRGYLAYTDWQKSIDCSAVDPNTGSCTQGPGIQSPANLVGDTTKDSSWVIAGAGTTSGSFGNVFYGTSTWAYNINGLVQLPKNFSISGNLNGREGYTLPYFVRVDEFNSVDGIRERQNLQINDVDSYRLDDLHLLDLRAAYLAQFGDTSVEISAEVFNALNDDTILQQQRRMFGSSAGTSTPNNLGRIFEVISPRIWRLGARVTFK